MTCARAGCRTELTPKQIGRGNLYCGQVCGCAIRRVKPVFTATHCANPACGKPLTVAQRRSRNPHHSIRCAMRMRYPGRQAPVRTHCALATCGAPLTRRQRWRRRDYHSKNCAKAAYWAVHREGWRQMTAASHAVQRRHYVARLRVFLATCTRAEAVARGFWTGYRVGGQRMRLRGSVRTARRADPAARAAQRAAIVAASTSHADAYRRAYRAGFDACVACYGAPARQAA